MSHHSLIRFARGATLAVLALSLGGFAPAEAAATTPVSMSVEPSPALDGSGPNGDRLPAMDTDCSDVWEYEDIRECTINHPPPTTPYSCDSTPNECTCVGVVDCFALKDSGECSGTMNCGFFSCTCTWN